MKSYILFILFLVISLNSKIVIGEKAEVVFGSQEIQVYGGISSESTENSSLGSVIFNPGSTIEFIGSAQDTVLNIHTMKNITVIKNSGNIILGQNLDINGNVNLVQGLIDTDGHTLILSCNGSRLSGVVDRETILNSIISELPEDMKISSKNGRIRLSWSEVKGSSRYVVYSSEDPTEGFEIDNTGTFNGSEWTSEISDSRRFFYVVAESTESIEKVTASVAK